MAADTLLTFGIVAFMAIILPGPSLVYMSSQATIHGFRAGVLATLGVLTGIIAHITTTSLGLTAIFMASAVAFEILRWVGVMYLCYLSYNLMIAKPVQASIKPLPLHRAYWRGLLTSLFNPKAIMFFMALFPQFIDHTHGDTVFQSAILGVEYLTIQVMIYLTICYVISRTRSGVIGSPLVQKIRSRVFGSMLGGSAILLAMANR